MKTKEIVAIFLILKFFFRFSCLVPGLNNRLMIIWALKDF